MQEASILEGDFCLRNPGLHHVQNFRLKKNQEKGTPYTGAPQTLLLL